jgi:hypothetical protein
MSHDVTIWKLKRHLKHALPDIKPEISYAYTLRNRLFLECRKTVRRYDEIESHYSGAAVQTVVRVQKPSAVDRVMT